MFRSRPKTRRHGSQLRTVGVNLLPTLRETGGGWNYVEQLVHALLSANTTDETGVKFVFFVNEESESIVDNRFSQIVRAPFRMSNRFSRILTEHTWLEWVARRNHIDVMWWPGNTKALYSSMPSVVTVHDLQGFSGEVAMSRLKALYLKPMMEKAIRSSEVICTPSRAVSALLEDRFGRTAQVFSVPAILAPEFRLPTLSVTATYGGAVPYFLYVSHLYPHKNHENLIRAAAMLDAAGKLEWRILLRGEDRGTMAALRALISELSLADQVEFVPALSAAEMAALVRSASAIVFPSLHEGGGIPVLEALASGRPCALSDIPSLREFAGEAAIYFDPKSPESISMAMSRMMSDESLRARLASVGVERVGVSSSKSIEAMWDAFSRALTS